METRGVRVRFSSPAHENRCWWTILECDGRYVVCVRERLALPDGLLAVSALSGLTAGASPVLHSDMGWQYRHPWWRERLGELGIRQSMSRKGNCLDNAATEQVFGHLKDEFYRDREFDS